MSQFNAKKYAALKDEVRRLPAWEGALKYFEAKLSEIIANQPVHGCWDYRRKDPDGYGLFNVMGKDYRLHRLSFEHFNGPIPEGSWVLHKCNNPACWKPDHLYSGDAQANAFDRVSAGTTRGKLPDETIFLIKSLIKEGLSNGQIAGRVGVTPGCVSHIRCGRRRKDVAA